MATISSIKAQIQSLIDTCEETTNCGGTNLETQINSLIEGYGRGETITVTDLSTVSVYVGDYADSDAMTVDSGAVNVYGRYITT